MTKQERLNEIYTDLRNRGIVRNLKDLALMLGVSYGNFTQAMKGEKSRLTDSLMSKVEALYGDPNLAPMKKESDDWVPIKNGANTPNPAPVVPPGS